MLAKKTDKIFYGYIILAIGWFIYFTNVAFLLYGVTVVNAHMIIATGFKESSVGFAVSLSTLIQGCLGVVVGFVVSKKGTRIPCIAGSVLLAAGCVLIAVCSVSEAFFIFFFGVILGVGMGFAGMLTVQVLVNDWFDKNKPLAMAIALTAGSVGGFVSPLFLEWVVSVSDWTAAWFVTAGVCLLSALFSLLFLVDKPKNIGEVPDGVAAHKNDKEEHKEYIEPITLKKLFKNTSFYYICLNYCAKSLLYYSVVSYLVIFLVSSGIPSGSAAQAVSLLSLLSLAGRIICGFIKESFIKPNKLITFCNISMAAGLLIVLTLPNMDMIFIASGIIGFGLGIGQVAMPLTISRFFGSSNFAKANGIVWPINYICGAIGPVLIGLMAAKFDSYALPFMIVAVITVVCGLPISFLKLPDFSKQSQADCCANAKFEADVK